jgi:hypothetical protein
VSVAEPLRTLVRDGSAVWMASRTVSRSPHKVVRSWARDAQAAPKSRPASAASCAERGHGQILS